MKCLFFLKQFLLGSIKISALFLQGQYNNLNDGSLRWWKLMPKPPKL